MCAAHLHAESCLAIHGVHTGVLQPHDGGGELLDALRVAAGDRQQARMRRPQPHEFLLQLAVLAVALLPALHLLLHSTPTSQAAARPRSSSPLESIPEEPQEKPCKCLTRADPVASLAARRGGHGHACGP